MKSRPVKIENIMTTGSGACKATKRILSLFYVSLKQKKKTPVLHIERKLSQIKGKKWIYSTKINILCLLICLKTKHLTMRTVKRWRTLLRELEQSIYVLEIFKMWLDKPHNWSEFTAKLALSKRLDEMVFWDHFHLKYLISVSTALEKYVNYWHNWKDGTWELQNKSTLLCGSPLYDCGTKGLHKPWAPCFCATHHSGKTLYDVIQDLYLGLTTCISISSSIWWVRGFI